MFIMTGINVETALFELYPKICEGIAGLKLKPGKGVRTEYLTVSLGAHIFEYLKEADKQLYKVMENGRNGPGCKNNLFRQASQPVYEAIKAIKYRQNIDSRDRFGV